MISYDKCIRLLRERGFSTYFLQRSNIISHSTYTAMKNHSAGITDTVINRLCRILECQPGDLMEYIPDDPNKELK